MTRRVPVLRLVAAVENIATDGDDDRALRAGILEAIKVFIPFDAYAFVLTDPATSVGCSPVAMVPDPAALPTLIRMKYLTTVNRWTGLPPSGCASLAQMTDGHPEVAPVWRDYLARLGIADVASVVFTDRFGWWGFLDLWRSEGNFTADEIAALSQLRAAVTLLLRGVQAAGFRASRSSPADRGPGALVLAPSLDIRVETSQAAEWFTALVPPQGGRSPIPASAYNVAAQLLAVEAGVDSHPAQARVHLGGGTWLTLRADRLAGDELLEQRDIMVTMEASSPAERRDIFCRAYGLTDRESELLRHLAEGDDTRAVALTMSISEFTVQDHLKSVFTKTKTSSRRELLAISLGV